MKFGGWLTIGLTLLLSGGPAMAATNLELADQVRAAERAFAKTMADRDLKAFESYVSSEALFFGSQGPLRGREAVVGVWKRFYEGPAAPFSWEPETVDVLDSGTLALSSGPVHDPDGKLINVFSSIWRLESDGRWRVIFDKGCPVCEPETKP
ncbi:MAG: nuclear transport factor 2 family protein [Candidatus Eisenbacteria bacterium]